MNFFRTTDTTDTTIWKPGFKDQDSANIVKTQLKDLKPGFHIVVSVVSVVRKKFIGQMQIYGNLPYKCSIQKKRQIQLFARDRMNSICPTNFFRTTDTTDTTIWKPGFSIKAPNHNPARICQLENWPRP